jgi:hypothetical protein
MAVKLKRDSQLSIKVIVLLYLWSRHFIGFFKIKFELLVHGGCS